MTDRVEAMTMLGHAESDLSVELNADDYASAGLRKAIGGYLMAVDRYVKAVNAGRSARSTVIPVNQGQIAALLKAVDAVGDPAKAGIKAADLSSARAKLEEARYVRPKRDRKSKGSDDE